MTKKKDNDVISDEKYKDKAIRFIDKGDHYELTIIDFFDIPCSGDSEWGLKQNTIITDVYHDMKEADKNKEIHVFVGSFGGAVVCLSMLLQQLMQFKHRVGINTGFACSCGWMLLFVCQERYVSRFSENMYHEMYSFNHGKIREQEHRLRFDQRWWNELLKLTDSEKILTPEELELGKTSEVYLTGGQLIERGAAKDYDEYLKRTIPSETKVIEIDGAFYKFEDNTYVKYNRSPKSAKT